MMLIKFTQPEGHPRWINPEQIIAVGVGPGLDGTHKTQIHVSGGLIDVREDLETVVNMLAGGGAA